ncbi:hypothetical protein Tco_1267120 [Tanacetum coccineum]
MLAQAGFPSSRSSSREYLSINIGDVLARSQGESVGLLVTHFVPADSSSSIPADNVPADSSSSVPADCVPADHFC